MDHNIELRRTDRRRTKQLLDLLAARGPTERETIAESLGIGGSTLSRSVADLFDANLVVEEITPPVGRGRPPSLLAVNARAASTIGIDLGYRHIRGTIVDIGHGVHATHEFEVPADYSIETAICHATALIDKLRPSSPGPVVGVGVALPGPVDRVTLSLTRSSFLPHWVGVPITELLADRLGLSVVADNEANLSAFAETVWGAASDVDSMIYLRIHVGVGGAIVAHGEVVRGYRGVAAEFGHLNSALHGELCGCGSRGCLEASIAIPRLLARASRGSAETMSFAEFCRRLRAGDSRVAFLADEAGADAGRALATLVNAMDPQVIMLAGPLISLESPLTKSIESIFRATALPVHADMPIRVASLGRYAASRGAAGYAYAAVFDDLLQHRISADPQPAG